MPAEMFAAIHCTPAIAEAHQRWVATPGTFVMPRRMATLRPMLPPPCIDSPKPMSSISVAGRPERPSAAAIETSAIPYASMPTSEPL